MAKPSTQRETSTGMCHFCGETFVKSKMTGHLKTCKVRLAPMKEKSGPVQRLFHVFVEGTYRPGYWMHLEVPAAAMLVDIDDFLREIWLECCGHLSEFTIKGASYASVVAEEGWGTGLNTLEVEEVGVDDGPAQGQPSAETIATQIAESLSAEMHADLKDVPVSQIEEKLVEMLSENLPPGVPSLSSPEFRPFLHYMATALQQGKLAEEMEAMEGDEDEGEMDVTLDEVLSVGETFSYIYDFGSSTHLSFRVVAEREGTLPAHLIGEDEEEGEEEEEDSEDGEDEDYADQLEIIVMARNDRPALLCHLCGKPATHVLAEADALDEAGLCAEHAQKQENPEELLPVVNSPRVGVCGYTGNEDEEDVWDAEEEEEEE